MNAWLLIRRLRGPAFIILVGITALLNQWGVLSFIHSWPLYLILAGVLALAERWALAVAPPLPPGAYIPTTYSPGAYQTGYTGPAPQPQYGAPAGGPGSNFSSGAGDDPLAGPGGRP